MQVDDIHQRSGSLVANRYRLLRVIGEGGMGRVYEALQTRPARTVAVKVISTSSPGDAAQQRFRREADALARLCHPGGPRVPVHASGAPRH